MTSIPHTFEIVKCNFPSANGRYQFQTKNVYVQVNGKLVLSKSAEGIWTVSNGKEKWCFGAKKSNLPTGIAWEYLSREGGGIRPSKMVVSAVTQTQRSVAGATTPTHQSASTSSNQSLLPTPSPSVVQPKTTHTGILPPTPPPAAVGNTRNTRSSAAASGARGTKSVLNTHNAARNGSNNSPKMSDGTNKSGALAGKGAKGGISDSKMIAQPATLASARPTSSNGNRKQHIESRTPPMKAQQAPVQSKTKQLQAGLLLSRVFIPLPRDAHIVVDYPTAVPITHEEEIMRKVNDEGLIHWKDAETRWADTVEKMAVALNQLTYELHNQTDANRDDKTNNETLIQREAELCAERDALEEKVASLIAQETVLNAQLEKVSNQLRISNSKCDELVRSSAQLEADKAALSLQNVQFHEDNVRKSNQLSSTESMLIVAQGEVANLSDANAVLEKENRAAQQNLARTSALNQQLQASLSKSSEELNAVQEKARVAAERADNLIARAGQSHIKRDWQQSGAKDRFPAGDDLKTAFMVPFVEFDSFACDVVYCLETMLSVSEDACKEILVHQIMTPIYNIAKQFVDDYITVKRAELLNSFGMEPPEDLTKDTVPKLFWFTSMQGLLPAYIAGLSDSNITELMEKMGDMVVKLHDRMLVEEQEGSISGGDEVLRIPRVIRELLKLFAYAALSDPTCYLVPAPGVKIAFHRERCFEVMSPGTKKYGQIAEGAIVEVVLCGLYFEDTKGEFGSVKPVVPALVRRIPPPSAAAPPVALEPALPALTQEAETPTAFAPARVPAATSAVAIEIEPAE